MSLQLVSFGLSLGVVSSLCVFALFTTRDGGRDKDIDINDGAEGSRKEISRRKSGA